MPELPTSQSSPESRPTRASSAGESEMHEGPETHLIDYVKVLYKRRWTAFTAFALVAGAITVYTFTATPIYEARTRLLLEAEEQNVVNFKQVVDEDQYQGWTTTTRPSTTCCRAARWRAARSTVSACGTRRRSAGRAIRVLP